MSSSSLLKKMDIIQELQKTVQMVAPNMSIQERNELVEQCLENALKSVGNNPQLVKWAEDLTNDYKAFLTAEKLKMTNTNNNDILRKHLESLL